MNNEDNLRLLVAFISTHEISSYDNDRDIVLAKADCYDSFVRMASKILYELYDIKPLTQEEKDGKLLLIHNLLTKMESEK